MNYETMRDSMRDMEYTLDCSIESETCKTTGYIAYTTKGSKKNLFMQIILF